MKFTRLFFSMILAVLFIAPAAFAAEVQIPGASTVDGPAAVVHNSCLWVFYPQSGGSLGYTTTTGNGTWTGSSFAFNSSVSLSPSAVSYNNHIYVFWRDTNSALIDYIILNTSGCSVASTVGGVHQLSTYWTGQAPEATVFNSQIFLVWHDSMNGFGFKFRHLTADSLGNLIADAPQSVPFGTSKMGPGAAAFNGRVYVNYRGYSTDGIYYGSQDTAGNWFGESNLGGPETSREPSGTTHNSHLYFVYKGKDTNNIYFKSMDTLGTWGGQLTLSGSRTSHSPSAVSFNSRLWFFYKGEFNNNLYSNSVQ